MMLPTPTELCTVASMADYHIFTFGDAGSSAYVITVMREGRCHDSYIVAGGSYISIPFEREA